MPNLIDLTGKRYGRLTVICRVPNVGRWVTWLCKCDCGNTIEVRSQSLRSGNTRSCGCIIHKHNGSKTRLYVVWLRMMERCYNQKVERYKNYGGRGITVCEDWHDFNQFRTWAMESGYDETANHYECTIDRIDVNGNYCPNNCRWISMNEQLQNTTRTHYVTVDGETMNITQASKKYGVKVATIWWRLKQGMDDEYAVKTKRLKRRKNVCQNVSLMA